MEIVLKHLSEIRPYENNPRNNEGAVKYVANSIKEFGFRKPIVVDKDNVIIVGHTRYKAAKMLGLEDVPCVVASNLSDEKVKEYRIADNKTAELATWNFVGLSSEIDNDYSMTDFGFGQDELEALMKFGQTVEEMEQNNIFDFSVSEPEIDEQFGEHENWTNYEADGSTERNDNDEKEMEVNYTFRAEKVACPYCGEEFDA